MENKIRKLLEEEIRDEIQKISSMTPGSKEKSTAVEDLTKLYRLKIEEDKNESNFIEMRERRAMDTAKLTNEMKLHETDDDFKKGQFAEQIKDRYFRIGIAAAELILPLMFYAIWMRKGFKFEENGTYTSTTFRGLFSRFKPTKK